MVDTFLDQLAYIDMEINSGSMRIEDSSEQVGSTLLEAQWI